MKIAVASGKGGTGKTTVSTALALSFSESSQCLLADCDVEEPNCELLLNLDEVSERTSFIPFFEFDKEQCVGCGKCKDACRFNCIAIVKNKAVIFPDLCHGCAGCLYACEYGAVKEINRENGAIRTSTQGNLTFVSGKLNIGEAMASPLVNNVKDLIDDGLAIIDSPPGASCAMVSAVSGSDYVLMVSEPTPFGLNDLLLAIDVLNAISIPFGVVINRHGVGDDRVETYCNDHDVEILGFIDDDIEVARNYSKGINPYKHVDDFTKQVDLIAAKLLSKRAGLCSK